MKQLIVYQERTEIIWDKGKYYYKHIIIPYDPNKYDSLEFQEEVGNIKNLKIVDCSKFYLKHYQNE